MKIAACVIAVNNLPYEDLAIKAISKYYNHFNIDLKIVKNHLPETVDTSPSWIKTLIFSIYTDVDFIIVQDLDLLPCNTRYDIRDFLLFDYFNAAVDCTRIGKDIASSPFPHFKYNGGLMAYPKKYQEPFKDVFEFGKPDPYKWETYEQYHVNKYLGDNGIYVNEIPSIFNKFWYPGIVYENTAFCHYTYNLLKEEKYDIIQEHHPKEMLV